MIWTGREETSWGFQRGERIASGLTALQRLGGSEYEAYLATDEETGDQVVVKLVRPHMVEETYPLRGLERELAILSELEHPGIVKLVRPGLKSHRPHLVLGYSPGRSLAAAVASDGPLDAVSAIEAVRRLADIVEHLSDREVVHLDIKPQNVIVGTGLHLIDFGIARKVEDARQLRSPTGTDAYMAPEQCRPLQRSVGLAADIWGLGATLHFAITGHPPFPRPPNSPTGQAGRWPQLSARLQIPSDMPDEIASLIRSCLRTEPDERPLISDVVATLEHLQ